MFVNIKNFNKKIISLMNCYFIIFLPFFRYICCLKIGNLLNFLWPNISARLSILKITYLIDQLT